MSGFELIGATEPVEALRRAVKRIGSASFRRELLDEMATVALALVREEFAVSRDPYGNPWAPVKKARFGAGPLMKTGKTQGSLRRKIVGDGFTLSVASPGNFHQSGTRKMVARPIFPTEDGIPDSWLVTFDRIAEAAVRRALESSL